MSRIIKGRASEYSSLLDQSDGEGIPFDITFKIVECGEVADEGSKEDEVKAHRLILASFSTVYKAMFYGPMRETRDVIPVKGTTIEAFKRMLDFFYQVDVDCSEMSNIELFELVNLSEKYNVTKLKEELKDQMEIVPISMENLMETVSIASECKHFEVASSALLLNCAKVLQKNIRGVADQHQFLLDQHASGKGALALELLSVVKTLEELLCGNCKEEEEECLDGYCVEVDKLRHGLKVKPLNTNFNWGSVADDVDDVADLRFKIVGNKLGNNKVRVKVESSNEKFVVPYKRYGSLTLCYDC